MAFAFGDSTVKLPPIRKESVEEASSRDSGGIEVTSVPNLHREKHGLVRLPPIVCLNSPKSDTRSSPGDDAWRMDDHSLYSLNPDTLPGGHRKFEETSDLSLARFSSPFSQCEEQQCLPNVNDICRTTDVSSHKKHGIRIAEEIGTELTPPRSLRRPSLSTVQDSLFSCTTRRLQGFSFSDKPLRKARPFAKSSPEISEGKQRTQQNPKIIKNTADSSVISGESTARRASVYDINATLILKSEEENVGGQVPSKHNAPKVEGTARQRTKRRNKDLAFTKTYSNPSSPVCNERQTSSKVRERKSLCDIEGFELPVQTRPVQSENLMKDDNTGLTIKGKTYPRRERRPGQMTLDSNKDNLAPPGASAKRDSLYDLPQILGILNQEGPDQSSASASANNASKSPGDGARNTAASVYDLRQFLSFALADAFQENVKGSSEEKISETQPQAEGNSCSLLNPNPTSRRVSAYDLMEFLTLGLPAKSSSQSSSRTSTPPAVSLPAGKQDSGPTSLEVPGGDSSRRSSTYDLMEFLSLRAASSRPHTPLQGKHNSGQSSSETLQESERKERSLSMYDLQEFLATQTPASGENRKTISPRQSKENLTVSGAENVNVTDKTSKETLLRDPSTLTGTSVAEGKLSIEGQRPESRQFSVYDLREFLKLYSFSRKASSISQSGVTIYVTDEKADRAESEEDPSLPIPQQADSPAEATQPRKPSTYDLTEILSALEADNSPQSRRMSSVSGASAEYHEHRPSISARTDSGGSNFLCVNSCGSRASFSDASRSKLVARQDSIGNRSLYDLHEFLTLLNSEDALTGPRSSNMTERGKVMSPTTSPARQDERFVYDRIEEHPRSDMSSDSMKAESQRPVENSARDMLKEDISIEVPRFLPKAAEKTIPDRFSIKNRLAALKSVPEATDN